VVALGKAARTMALALEGLEIVSCRRRVVVEEPYPSWVRFVADVGRMGTWLRGDHPVPGERSLAAGAALLEFLEEPSDAEATVFLVSGGASSLCAAPAPPLGEEDLAAIFRAATRVGADITTLNRLRAATSLIAGGAVLSHVRTPRSTSLIMVDNLVSGAPWVASGLTYGYRPHPTELESLIDAVGLEGALAERVREAAAAREAAWGEYTHVHENKVLLEPADMVRHLSHQASAHGYHVLEWGRPVLGDVQAEAEMLAAALAAAPPGPTCLIGVGEVAVRVAGEGEGGRCQELAWRCAPLIEGLGREAVVVARATDGRDFVEGVAGAWVDSRTAAEARAAGIDHGAVLAASDTHRALGALERLIRGGPSGWNLCDLYLGMVGPR
jgi:glycerate 2-kinase